MRVSYLFLSMLVVTGLTACQQESPSTPKGSQASQPESTMSSPQVVQSEVAEPKISTPEDTAADIIAESAPEAAKEIIEETSKAAVVVKKVSEHKAVEEVKAVVTPTAPMPTVAPKPIVVSSPVVERPAEVATVVVEEAKPVAVVENASGDPVQGAKIAKKCVACHTFNSGGKNKTGPNLFGVVGNTKGAVAGFRYGSYLKAQNATGATWDEISLRAWLADSIAAAKAGGGTSKMSAQKITGTKADDLIAYLKTLK
jgi:cytochrome c2